MGKNNQIGKSISNNLEYKNTYLILGKYFILNMVMIVKIKLEYYNFFKINIINFAVIFLLTYINSINNSYFSIPISIVVAFIYMGYLLEQSNITIIKYQISYLLISQVIVEYLFLITSFNISFMTRYMVDLISIILLLKICINYKKYHNAFKDPFIILIVFSMLVSLVINFANSTSAIEIINGIRMYYRFIPVFIVLSCDEIKLKDDYTLYYIINIILFILLFLYGLHQDNINGIFGATGTTSMTLFVLVFLTNNLVKFLFKKVSAVKVAITIVGTMILFVIQENKAFIFISIFLIFIIAIMNNANLLKKTIVFCGAIITLLIGMKLLVYVYPDFEHMFSKDTYKQSIENYLFKNNNSNFTLGRFEALSYLKEVELDTIDKELFGLGMGTALPNENWYFDNKSRGREIVDFPNSTLFNKYGINFGYHLSSYNIVFIENGMSGILVFILILIIMLYRSIYIILRSNNLEIKIIGSIGVMGIFASLFPIIYGNAFFTRTFNLILILICGITTYNYKVIKKIINDEEVTEGENNV